MQTFVQAFGALTMQICMVAFRLLFPHMVIISIQNMLLLVQIPYLPHMLVLPLMIMLYCTHLIMPMAIMVLFDLKIILNLLVLHLLPCHGFLPWGYKVRSKLHSIMRSHQTLPLYISMRTRT